jgi:hypothetical protein
MLTINHELLYLESYIIEWYGNMKIKKKKQLFVVKMDWIIFERIKNLRKKSLC